ncbi:MAG: HAMP domain-containing sensor histidine kinase [Thermoleophilia bacterium]
MRGATHMTLRLRVAVLAAASAAALALLVAGGAYALTRSQLRSSLDAKLLDRAQSFIPHGGPGGRGDGGGPGQPDRLPFGDATGIYQWLSADGTVQVPQDQGTRLPVTAAALQVARGGGRAYGEADVGGTHLRTLVIGVQNAGTVRAVQAALPLTEVDRTLRRLLIMVGLLAAVGIAGAAALGTLVARAALNPVRAFTAAAERLAGGADLSQRLEVTGHDELTRLATSYNRSLAALERSIDAQRQLVADAGHELRTPIASIRTNIQTLLGAHDLPESEVRAIRDDITTELDELTALVRDVVDLARGQEVARGDDLGDVDLGGIVEDAVERFRRRYPGLNVRTRVQTTLVSADPERVGRAVWNVLDNAGKWSPDGATVDVTLTDDELCVRDRGPGFSDADLPHVFDRFYRSTRARGVSGSGLGLAIVRQTAEATGGTAVAENAPDGGAVLRVRFGGAA